MNILSLFDGMSCGQIAAERAGIKIDKYYASEIDKYAIKVTQANYPDTIQLGDIENWREWDIDWSSIDLVFAGSPCQGFSYSGKGLAFDDPRSKLFFDAINVLHHAQCQASKLKFLFENVKMIDEYRDIMTRYLGFEPVLINSALVSAQRRERNYWTNWSFGQPEDKGLLLADIIEDGIVDRDKSFCLDANYFKGGNLKSYFEKHRRQLVFIHFVGRGKNPTGPRALNGKTPTLTSNAWEQNNFLAWIKENDVSFRKLTPIECERLQTVPDNYTNHVSNTQRYKMLGNGWNIDTIVHILKGE